MRNCYFCGAEFSMRNRKEKTYYCSATCQRLDMHSGRDDVYVNVGKYDFMATNRGIVNLDLMRFLDEKRSC